MKDYVKVVQNTPRRGLGADICVASAHDAMMPSYLLWQSSSNYIAAHPKR